MFRRRFPALLLALACLTLVAGRAPGAPITYTETATASGRLGTSIFTNSVVTLMATADTANVITVERGRYVVQATTATVDVASLGTATITTPIVVFKFPPSTAQAGFGTGSTAGYGSFLITLTDLFDGFSLATPFGPITGTASLNPADAVSVGTTRGELSLTSLQGTATFSATTGAVPAPASLVTMATGLAAVAGLACYRRRVA